MIRSINGTAINFIILLYFIFPFYYPFHKWNGNEFNLYSLFCSIIRSMNGTAINFIIFFISFHPFHPFHKWNGNENILNSSVLIAVGFSQRINKTAMSLIIYFL